ncbi:MULTISPECIES: cobyrinate a,c-diamide synthase [unclassified Methanoregula]|uniref:cobyrinate a,c-diamide synthase n=1 Tax=unclassified Methanoregula TaxID=2649730 RepID=UPI0009D2A0EB|nr:MULTISPECIES: cobyrinate a,c-diamide synthase [unclassified Methanoregula]OPX64400.1 MAG: cobyrinic acid a,c-diamide synthase [Methanoregula sp. PtaB.Bin085]OPY34930.1 MAG: cobyrinic acid a,c-diamide synthase [Methanoregula sp. PtaU1.Bin006]
MPVTIPRIVVAGTESGCGKTSVAGGLMAALGERGLQVQPFKTGPDFIDPTHHTALCGRVSRNLDTFMMGEQGVLQVFVSASRGADIAVIEGAMGLFDGIDGTDFASTSHVARILDAPVLLVVNAGAASRSVHAVVRGFQAFDPRIRITGVIFNRLGSARHRSMIAAEEYVPAIGYIPRQGGPGVQSRHLGLVMAHESDGMEAYGAVVRDSCNLDAILAISRSAPEMPRISSSDEMPEAGKRAVIGIAWDRAFCFYYQDNLDRLRQAGAELRFFSPMDDRLPDTDGLYIGGGYPELYAGQLETSQCRHAIREMADRGMPVYDECGGLMYLSRSISADREYRMAGILPASAEMTDRIQALGYVKGTFPDYTGSWAGASPVLGHEFHYSRVICDRDARFSLCLTQGTGIREGNDGLTEHNAVGTYTHAYFNDTFCRQFVAAAEAFRRKGK